MPTVCHNYGDVLANRGAFCAACGTPIVASAPAAQSPPASAIQQSAKHANPPNHRATVSAALQGDTWVRVGLIMLGGILFFGVFWALLTMRSCQPTKADSTRMSFIFTPSARPCKHRRVPRGNPTLPVFNNCRTGGRLDLAFLASQCRAYIRLSRAASHSPALGSLFLLGRLLSVHPLSWSGLARSLWFGALQPRCTAF
jgi:hypothetical protein